MNRPGRLVLTLLILAATRPAWGHPMPSTAVELRLRGRQIDVALTLPIIELTLGWDRPLPTDPAQAARDHGADLRGYVRDHVGATAPDGRPWTVEVGAVTPGTGAEPDLLVGLTMTPPPGAPVDRLTFRYDAIFHHLITHTAVVTLAGDWRNGVVDAEPALLGTMRDIRPTLAIDRSGGSWWRGFAAMFRLGTRHIAEGTDHLLFLLALMLPAPLVAAGWRWSGDAGWRVALGRILRIVTAFTLGHSLTLALGALGWVDLPGVLVESAIAVSILVSSVHALVPIFRGREVVIAGGFGLVHGLAFASTLTDFGFDPWTTASSILGFNLGIEAVQLLVIGATMPWLVLLARTGAYRPFRIAGAILIGVAASAWFAERALGQANPVAPLVEGIAARWSWLLGGLIGLTLLALGFRRRARRSGPTDPPVPGLGTLA